jgi:hypothetical protein
MKPENPYQPPTSSVDAQPGGPPGRWRTIVILLVAFHTLLAAAYATTLLGHWRHGEISAVTFLASASASVLLLIGALVYRGSVRYAQHFFSASTLMAVLAFLQWRPPFVLSGLLIAFCATLVSAVARRRA